MELLHKAQKLDIEKHSTKTASKCFLKDYDSVAHYMLTLCNTKFCLL